MFARYNGARLVRVALGIAALGIAGCATDETEKPADTSGGSTTVWATEQPDPTCGGDDLGTMPTSFEMPEHEWGGRVAIGDVTGDGAPDAIVARYGADLTCVYDGPVPAGDLSLAGAYSCIAGEVSGDYSGVDIAAGDVTGDGIGDLLIGSYRWQTTEGSSPWTAYVVAGPVPAGTTTLASAYAAWDGEGGDYHSVVEVVGDVTGDGSGDVALAAPGRGTPSAVYIAPGPVTEGRVDADTLTTTIVGASCPDPGYYGKDHLGMALTGPGDIDGDGIDDLVIVQHQREEYDYYPAGVAAWWYGPLTPGSSDTCDADAFVVTDDGSDDFDDVTSAGDMDGDGLVDVVLHQDRGIYLVLGAPPTDPSAVSEAAHATILLAADDWFLGAVTAGDVDGDGAGDLLLGLPSTGHQEFGPGVVYIVHGPIAPGEHIVSMDHSVVGSDTGAGVGAGSELAGGGDLDGDGRDDMLVGSDGDIAYLLPGGCPY